MMELFEVLCLLSVFLKVSVKMIPLIFRNRVDIQKHNQLNLNEELK